MISTRSATGTTIANRRENFIGGDPHDVLQPLDYFVWAIVGACGTFIVDTGFDETMAQKRKRLVTNPIGEGLKAIGIDPETVENVIVTHLHYDHAGNYELFPRARYHLQDVEMGYATGRCMCHASLQFPFEVDDVVAMVRKVFAGRVEFHDGADQIVPGITVHRVGGHSKGLQCVRVKTKRGDVVIASDATHLYAHIETGRVFPILTTSATCWKVMRRSRSWRRPYATSFLATTRWCLPAIRPHGRGSRVGRCGSMRSPR